MAEVIDGGVSCHPFVGEGSLIDLGRLPDRIRSITRFWGGSTTGSRALFELATSDGFTRSLDQLRREMNRVHDPKVRNELLAWLESRIR